MRWARAIACFVVLVTVTTGAINAQAAGRVEDLRQRRDSLARALRAIEDSLAALQQGVTTSPKDTVFVGRMSRDFAWMSPIPGEYYGSFARDVASGVRARIVGVDTSDIIGTKPHWLIELPNGKRYFVPGESLYVENGAQEALEFFTARQRKPTPLNIVAVVPAPPNSADGVDVAISFQNTDPRRTIKYVTFSVVPYNSVVMWSAAA